MGFDPHGEVFYGYDLGDLMAQDTPDDADRPRFDVEDHCTAPAWMLEDPDDPTLGLGEGYGYWETELAQRLAGWVDLPFPEEAHHTPAGQLYWTSADTDREHPAYKAWVANLDRKREIVAGAGCDLAAYGACEGASPDGVRLRVAVTASIVGSSYDCVPLPGLMTYAGAPHWQDVLHRFLDVLDIPRPAGGPGWHLTSDYG